MSLLHRHRDTDYLVTRMRRLSYIRSHHANLLNDEGRNPRCSAR